MEKTNNNKTKKILIVILIIFLLILASIFYFLFGYIKPKGLTLCQNYYTCSQLEEDKPSKTLMCQDFTCQKVACENNNDCQNYCETYAKDLKNYKREPIVSTGFACSNDFCSCVFKTTFQSREITFKKRGA